jgi:hypothetical protein
LASAALPGFGERN